MYAISAEEVSKSFINHKALDNVSISVPKGSIFGLLGPNGAGKTTLIRIINQIYAPDGGVVKINGELLSPKHVENIGYLPEERGLYKKMKVGEQAIYLAQLKGLSKREALKRLKYWFEKFEIQAWWDKKVEELSKGMAQKVQFIVTVIHEPQLLIFDEPFSGFDPINANLMRDEMLDLRKNGATIIFSTHNMSSVEEICDHVALIDRSRKILDGRVDEIKETYRTNRYHLDYIGDLENAKGETDLFSIQNVENGGKFQRAIIQAKGDFPPNELLKKLIQHVEIHGFNEVLPSMNDIFISVVQGNVKI
ncbi:MAG: ATP-binding cassette domain-containing protein [Salinivirgaceae bacterium]|nr:ATP-binding cassette domain-containing protein [Salinivirgaceae bacterium]MDD4748240.1 ATP-binding cassette domain-containing protein [Salinivirgaceae bacterium]MDY0280954.1 ATP-binding cassette domain-containing protein [Salinivirgaceae bacterium]